MIALLIISGCVDNSQIQTESDWNQIDNGWDQAKYQEYSRLYNELQRNGHLTGFVGGLQGDRTKFEWAWGNAFEYYEKGLKLEAEARAELDNCYDQRPNSPYERARERATTDLPYPIRTPTKPSHIAQEQDCLSQYRPKMMQAQSYFTKSRYYLQMIEGMKPSR